MLKIYIEFHIGWHENKQKWAKIAIYLLKPQYLHFHLDNFLSEHHIFVLDFKYYLDLPIICENIEFQIWLPWQQSKKLQKKYVTV